MLLVRRSDPSVAEFIADFAVSSLDLSSCMLCTNPLAFHLCSQKSPNSKILDVDKTGNQDSLRFPPFHQEILEQRHWDAAELYGRIRVVIAEGFCRPHRYPPFERVKEIVAFAFQHAPLRKCLI